MIEPDILLLDEPLSNLDAKLRQEVRVEIRELQKKLGLTTVMVTHDQEEALTMADRLVVMSAGEVQQIGTQRDLYERPANTFVAGFVGRTNFLHGRVEAPGLFRTTSGLAIRCQRRRRAGGRVLALRPERLSLFLGAGRGGRQLDSRDRRVRLVSRRHPGILCALDAAGPADGAGAEPDRRRRVRGRRSDPSDWPAAASLVLADDGGGAGLDETPSRDGGPHGKASLRHHAAPSLKATGALAGVAAMGGFSPAYAQSGGRVVLGTWGGDYSKLLAKNIDTPLMVPKKYEVVHDIGGDPERRAKMRAEARLPRGTSDLQGLSRRADVRDERGRPLPSRSTTRRSRTRSLLPQMKYPYGVGHIYSGKVILYNPKLITTPPTSFADAIDPKHGNKLGIIDIQYQFTMMAAALASGGSMTNYEPGKERLMACRKAGARILPTNEAMAQALQNEEVGICIMWKARAVQWQKAGAKVDTVAPKEGIPLSSPASSSPRTREQGRRALLAERVLEPSAQEAFAEDMGYNGTVTNAKIPPETEKRIGFNAEERKRLVDLDYGYLAKNDAALKGGGTRRSRAERPPATGGHGTERWRRPQPTSAPARRGWTAAAMVAPASIVDDRHRAAGRDPVPLQPEPVHAGQGDGRRRHARELREVLHRSVLIARSCSGRNPRRGAVHGGLRRARLFDGLLPARTRSRFKNLLLMRR